VEKNILPYFCNFQNTAQSDISPNLVTLMLRQFAWRVHVIQVHYIFQLDKPCRREGGAVAQRTIGEKINEKSKDPGFEPRQQSSIKHL
jgi:hypothetical protein